MCVCVTFLGWNLLCQQRTQMEAIKILYKTLDNVQTEKTKLFHKTKLGKASLINVNIWDNAQGGGEG